MPKDASFVGCFGSSAVVMILVRIVPVRRSIGLTGIQHGERGKEVGRLQETCNGGKADGLAGASRLALLKSSPPGPPWPEKCMTSGRMSRGDERVLSDPDAWLRAAFEYVDLGIDAKRITDLRAGG
jgi:hypothetical protein